MDLFQFVTLVGSVHFVEWGLDPSWGSSTLWTYLSFLPLSGPSTLWTGVLTLGGSIHFVDLYRFFTLVGSVHVVDRGLDPWWGPSTLWIYISFLPLSGPSTLCTGVLTFWWGPSTMWTCKFSSLVGFVHVVDWGLDP